MTRTMSFLIFRIALTLIIGLIQWYFYRRTAHFVRSKKNAMVLKHIVQSFFILFNVPLIMLLIIRPQLLEMSQWFIWFGVYPFYVWHSTFVLLFVVLFVLYMFRVPFVLSLWLGKKIKPIRNKIESVQRTEQFERWNASRRVFLQRTFTLIAGTTFVGTAYGAYTKYDYEITSTTISLHSLPEEFEGFTITLVADIHSSVFMTKEDMVRYVQVINTLNSDMIVIPGDFVNSMLEEVYPLVEAFSELKAPSGVFGSLGNHDFFTDVELVARKIDECGVKLLRNDNIKIHRNGTFIQLLGVDDTGRVEKAEALYDRAISGTDSSTPKILLCHRPYFFEQAIPRNIDLTLSGHTHGGQIVFAKIGKAIIAPARMASPYVAGLYKKGNAQMYVTRGIGTVGIPIRINCPPEITVIRLTKAL